MGFEVKYSKAGVYQLLLLITEGLAVPSISRESEFLSWSLNESRIGNECLKENNGSQG